MMTQSISSGSRSAHGSAALTLYGYWRSSASYRVRMALNLKALDYRQYFVHLLRDGGQQLQPDYLKLNPQGLIPALTHGKRVLTQSLAIMEYLDEVFPDTPLLPGDAEGRARVRALCGVIACDTHPLNNLRVLKYLGREFGLKKSARDEWYRHWVSIGLDAFERMLANQPDSGRCCHGDLPTMADCCLLPQVYNARRFECDESGWPHICRISAHLADIPAVARAAPENQNDSE
ncbi:MAG: maleylacetoacetate isomerase [Xanthomonadaceae bacterium]|nr:maleylacetoacetate isomerase [Xanthomonadaceae bacterium]